MGVFGPAPSRALPAALPPVAAVFAGRNPCHLLEHARKILHAGITQPLGNFLDRHFGTVEEPFLRLRNPLINDIIDEGHAGLFLEEAAELIRGQPELGGRLLQRQVGFVVLVNVLDRLTDQAVLLRTFQLPEMPAQRREKFAPEPVLQFRERFGGRPSTSTY